MYRKLYRGPVELTRPHQQISKGAGRRSSLWRARSAGVLESGGP